MEKEFELTDQLRMQLLGALHVGSLKPGAKLPSIREVAQRHNVDHRIAARAYNHLENESLVEIRGRSGVYVANVPGVQAQVMDNRMQWVSRVLREGWAHRITLPELHHLMHKATVHQLRCVCVESTQDHLIAVTSELASDFGFTVVGLRFQLTYSGELEPASRAKIEAEIRASDLLVTTVFEAGHVRELAARAGKPMVAVSINPQLRDEMARRISGGRLVVVVADPAFLTRATAFLRQLKGGDNVELRLARDHKRRQNGHDESRTIYTKAARRELGLAEFHLLSADTPFISGESAQEIFELIVRLSCAPRAFTARA